MAASSNKIDVHHIDANQTAFYNPGLKKLADPEFKKALLNTKEDTALADAISQNSRFDESYRAGLVSCLKAQYERSSIKLEADSAVAKNIEKLADTKTLTVTTGQQIHIFLGPFFVVNKILSCCAEARKYKDQLVDYDIVPIFWMATEDHDFDEIKSARLYNETYTWDQDSNGPVGRLNPSSLLHLVSQARERIDQTEENIQFLDVCEFAYGNCSTFADATRYIIHHYFESFGLVVIDPDDAFLKSKCIELIEDDIFANSPSRAINESIAKMKELGIKAPINTRPINTFLISDKERNRIQQTTKNEYNIVGTSTSLSGLEIKTMLREHPEAFSPNALLRPIYQQSILPNLHYVCGASEIMYWLELKIAMNLAHNDYPNLSIRKSLFFISQKNIQKLDTHEIALNDLFVSVEDLTDKIVTRDNHVLGALEKKIEENEVTIQDLLSELNGFEIINLKKIEKTTNQLFTELRKQLTSIIEKKSEHNIGLNQVIKIKSNLYNENYNQERNKFIISMISQLQVAQNLFKDDYHNFLNHDLITLTSN